MGLACAESDPGENRVMAPPRHFLREFARARNPARGRHHDQALVFRCDLGDRFYDPDATAFRLQKDPIALGSVPLRLLQEAVGELGTDGLTQRMTTTDAR